MKKSYDLLAKHYNYLQKDMDYSIWQDFLIDNINIESSNILEIGCGTGKVANFLKINGHKVDAFDLSEEMIKIANNFNPDINFYVDDITTFHVDKKYDYVLCFMDTLNYIINYEDLKKSFVNVHNSLNDGGLFLFDVHKVDNLKYFDDYEEEQDLNGVKFQWKSTVMDKLMIHEMSFDNETEVHKQYIYSDILLEEAYKDIFEVESITTDGYKDFYVLRKV